MTDKQFKEMFTEAVLQDLMPPEKSDRFFEALYGDADEGAYTIALSYQDYDSQTQILKFELQLMERPGKCLSCNLTYGLPDVLARHPLINIQGLVQEIEKLLAGSAQCSSWQLGTTNPASGSLHTVPLTIKLTEVSP